MGRGRAKAKQTKVARQLKYGGPETDLDRLQAELASGGTAAFEEPSSHDDNLDDEYDGADDPYSKYLSEMDGDDDLDEVEDEVRQA